MNCTGKRCLMQHGKVDPATCQCVSYCPQATPPKTNADRIRAMSDEELVEFLAPYNSGCPKEHGSVMTCHDKGCYKCWEDWLKKEVKEE